MCSIVMPADYEMLVSHSPPIFSHSPPTGFLSRYDPFSRQIRTCKPIQSPQFKQNNSPKRPCLVIRQDDSSSDEDPTSPTRLKKKVVFADDRGMSLTHVRVMTEPSNVPPVWSFGFFAQVTQGINLEPLPQQELWEINFSQPASDYVEFRKRLDTNKVSLENVIIKETDDMIIGTVKVSNLHFEKVVFIRTSTDSWKSQKDIPCTFVPNSSVNSVYILYDTFSFKVSLPEESRELEFCVCFRCEGCEFWDNNANQNYRLIKKAAKHQKNNIKEKVNTNIKCSDIFNTKVDQWSEFASWTHFDNNNPYW